jgi:hypothetical protein
MKPSCPGLPGDLAPCDFFLFTRMKFKLKGRRFDTIEEIQAESQRVLDNPRQKRTFRKRSKNVGDGGTGVCMWEGTTWRVMATDRPYVELYDFSAYVRNILDTTSHMQIV